VAFFFELFWLDVIPVGTFIPPAGLFSTIASLSLIHVLGVTHPGEIFILLTATIPFAAFMAWLESRQRLWQNREFNLLVVSTRKGNARLFAPGSYIRKGIVQSLLLQGGMALVILLPLTVVLDCLLAHTRPVAWISWPLLWLVASLGGVIAMRFRRAYFYLTAAIALTALILWAGLTL
jgi:PTS system mannose-specific IIC component